MDSNSWLLYVLLAALILGGGYFAGAEIAFASCNKIRLKTQADAGNRTAQMAVYISEHFDNALTTLLIGNNIMHIGCSSLATLLANKLWGPSSVGPTTIVITLVVFFVSEMLPKSFCRSHADQVVLWLAGSPVFDEGLQAAGLVLQQHQRPVCQAVRQYADPLLHGSGAGDHDGDRPGVSCPPSGER